MSGECDAAALPNAWPLYFDEDYDAEDRRRMLVAELVDFFASPQGARFFVLHRCVRAVGGGAANCGADVAFSVDYDDLAAACGSADLVASLEVQPLEGLACLAAAAHEVRRGRERETREERWMQRERLKALHRLAGLFRNPRKALRSFEMIVREPQHAELAMNWVLIGALKAWTEGNR